MTTMTEKIKHIKSDLFNFILAAIFNVDERFLYILSCD